MTKRVARSNTTYDVSLQRRDGKAVAIIEAETANVYEDGRGYAGQDIADRQVMIVPLSSLSNLAESIVRTLTYNTTADPEERYDLDTDAQPRIGLYAPEAPSTKPANTFYTLAEARQVFKSCGPGWLLAHLPTEGEDFRNIIERKS